MPKATVNLEAEAQKELKTCPGGWVVLRRMSYGAKLNRMQHVGKMSVEMRKGSKSNRAEMDLMQRAATVYDFQQCVVDHNLFADDEETIKLDLRAAMAIDSLDPRIGEEISTLIDELNNFEDEEATDAAGNSLGNSTTASGPQ